MAKACYEYLPAAAEGPWRRVDACRRKDISSRWPTVLAQQQVDAIIQGKLAASYWLGLIQYEQLGEFRRGAGLLHGPHAAIRPEGLFGPPGPITTSPAPWKPADSGRRRSTGYESSILLAERHGNLVRARWLKELDGEKDKEPEGRRGQRKRRWRKGKLRRRTLWRRSRTRRNLRLVGSRPRAGGLASLARAVL